MDLRIPVPGISGWFIAGNEPWLTFQAAGIRCITAVVLQGRLDISRSRVVDQINVPLGPTAASRVTVRAATPVVDAFERLAFTTHLPLRPRYACINST